MKTITLVLFAGLLLSGQTADVKILDETDTIIARTAYQNLTEAQRVWNEANSRIKKKYHIEADIEFSRDFKAVIPKATSGTSAWRDWCLGGTPCETRSGMILK